MFEINPNLNVKIKFVDGKQIFEIKDFYLNPDGVRDYALKSKKYTREDNQDLLAYSIGRRVCEDDLRLSFFMKDVFEQLCNHSGWHIKFEKEHHEYRWSGMRFMVNVTNNQEILDDGRDYIAHVDGPDNKWACVVYLNTPNECAGGTEFHSYVKEYDRTKIVYTSKMEYNKAVLYDANMIHGAIMNTDMFKHHDRLVQIMFM